MATTYLTRTLGTPTDNLKWTFSAWIKRSAITGDNPVMSIGGDTSAYTRINFNGNGQIEFDNKPSGFEGRKMTSGYHRDPAAWYHVVVIYDSANATPGDRMIIYINGSRVTAFGTDADPDASTASGNTSGQTVRLGILDTGTYFSGAMAHAHFCDGQAYAASNFGETDSTSGIWIPITSPSVTYGNNGFFAKFADGATLTDSSGEGNNFTLGGGTVTALKDSPDNNFCTMNPLEKNTNNTQTFSNANNTAVITAGYAPIGSTMSVSKGKWYAECHIDSTASSGDLNIMLGINGSYNDPGNNTLGYSASAYGYYLYNGYMLNTNTSNSNTGGTQYVTSPGGGIVDDNKYWALALDCDNNKLYVRLDGTWLESADPSAGTGGYGITAPASTDWGCYRFANGVYFGNTNTFKWNFGNGFFGTTSAGATNADSDGYGVFKYSVPTGFKALCTAQLATYG